MERQRSPLRFGAPLQFGDRWQGRLLACEVDAAWAVQNLILSCGILLRRTVRLPFAAASRWGEDGVAFPCTADEAFGGGVIPVAVPTHRLAADMPVAGAKGRLMGLLVQQASRKASHLLLGHGVVAPDEYMIPVEKVSLNGGVIRLGGQAEAFPMYRPDSDLVQAVRQAIASHPYLSEDDRRGLQVEAVDGIVYLRGNVRTVAARNWAQECARQVRGVLGVRNELVDDTSLEMAIAQALATAGFFRQARVFVRSMKGEVLLTGYAPSQAVMGEIERVASAVAGVRSVSIKLQIQPSPAAEAAKGDASP